MPTDSAQPALPEVAARIADLMTRLIAVLEQETALVGPGLARNNRALAESKGALAAELAARMEAMEMADIDGEAAALLVDLNHRLSVAAAANETALQGVLDSHARILRNLSEQAARRAGTTSYGPTGVFKDKPKPPGALPGGGKKI